VIAAGLVIVPSVSLPATASERIAEAVRDPVFALQDNGRWALYEEAAELVREQPLRGVGAGGFQSVGELALVPENYPHNLFLELYAELGLLAALAVVASTIAVLLGLLRAAWRHPEAGPPQLVYVVIGVLLLNLFSAQLSGDINENRAFWAALGLAWLVAHNPSVLAARSEPEPRAGARPHPR
jgi:O-antigen ligase